MSIQQECIPVGCVPSTAVAISGGGGCLPAGGGPAQGVFACKGGVCPREVSASPVDRQTPVKT